MPKFQLTGQYNDIREEEEFKNVIIANRMVAESQAKQYPFIDPSEEEQFRKHKFSAYYWWVVLHELLGHGTGRMMVETERGSTTLTSTTHLSIRLMESRLRRGINSDRLGLASLET